MDKQDFGNDYLEFYPAVNGLNQYGNPSTSQVCIDGWFTSAQLRNIAAELERLEAQESNAAPKNVNSRHGGV